MTRTQHDSMGPVELPNEALYGPQTARAMVNFNISGWTLPRCFLAALGLIKQAAATSHRQAGRLDEQLADAIIAAAGEVADGTLDEQFPVDVFQTGSGTSTNMNANEVIANRACQLLGSPIGDTGRVHPNDHVNMGQSSNDVIPTALQASAAAALHDELIPALRRLRDGCSAKAAQFNDAVTIARTHLMDAVPIRMGQVFDGYAAQLDEAIRSLQTAMAGLCELPIGGTAVGTGLNAPAGLAEDICVFLHEELHLPFCETPNHHALAGSRDAVLRASGALRAAAVTLGKIASDIRLLASGPRCGLGELQLPPLQPGSSIMPGKVNPVICEMVVQVTCQVVGCDAAIAAANTGGVGSILQLNVAMPLMASNLLTQIQLLSRAAETFQLKAIADLTVDRQRCGELIEQSLAMATALAPVIGYDRAAAVAKTAHQTNRTIREVCLAENILDAEQLDELLDPQTQTDR